MPFGPLEIGIVLVIALVIFGPKRLPDLGKSLGSGMKEFKDSITGDDDDAKKKQVASSETKSEPVRAEKSEPTPSGGQSS
jgi:sec-independent protein translocase protein TatA